MNTTALLVDILIIGIQVLIWIFGVLSSFVINPKETLSYFSEFSWLSILLILVTAYSIGIIFDYIIPGILKPLEKKIDKKNNVVKKKGSKNVIDILHDNPNTHKFLDNHFSRVRIARATLFNLPLITLSIIIFLFSNDLDFSWEKILNGSIILLLGGVLTIASFKSWVKRKKVYSNYVRRAYELLD